MRLTFHVEADAEVTEAARYYELQVEDLGVSFLDELDAALDRIIAHPKASPLVGREVRPCAAACYAASPCSAMPPLRNPNGVR